MAGDITSGVFDTLGGDGDIEFDFNSFENSLKALLGIGAEELLKPFQTQHQREEQHHNEAGVQADSSASDEAPRDCDTRTRSGQSEQVKANGGARPNAKMKSGQEEDDDERLLSVDEISAQLASELAGTRVMESFATGCERPPPCLAC